MQKLKVEWKKLVIPLAIPLGTGLLSALVSMRGMKRFASVAQPPLSPPGWLFPVVWTVLYLMMGYASFRVWRAQSTRFREQALRWYGAQLTANFLWSPLFFGLGAYLPALLWLCILVALTAVTMFRFRRLDRTAGMLLLPYLCWLLFACYLNAGVWVLNR